jgi:cytosine/adenosine deaminase-related metal-dependent hydrolase
MLIRAHHVLLPNGPLKGGGVRVEGRFITETGPLEPRPGEECFDLGDTVLSPGLINAHCHLDYTAFRGSIMPTASFTRWIKNINALKRDFTPQDFIASIEEGYQMLLDSGTTSVGNIEAFPEILPLLKTPPLRVWWFLELIDLRSRAHNDESFFGMLQFFDDHPEWLGGFGLSPHAPYTASVDLYRLAKTCSEKFGMPFTTHIAESVEEQEMFLHGQGPLHSFLQEVGRDNSDCGHGSALSHLLEHGVLTSDCLVVHLNYLQEYDWEPLQESGVSVVHCPKCHTYFGHRPFPLDEIRRAGINICLGTDSLASNNSLDLRSEIREAHLKYPEIPSSVWWEMVTLNPAKALRQEGRLGVISPGAGADLVAFATHGETNPYLALINSKEKPAFLMINGRRIASP